MRKESNRMLQTGNVRRILAYLRLNYKWAATLSFVEFQSCAEICSLVGTGCRASHSLYAELVRNLCAHCNLMQSCQDCTLLSRESSSSHRGGFALLASSTLQPAQPWQHKSLAVLTFPLHTVSVPAPHLVRDDVEADS